MVPRSAAAVAVALLAIALTLTAGCKPASPAGDTQANAARTDTPANAAPADAARADAPDAHPTDRPAQPAAQPAKQPAPPAAADAYRGPLVAMTGDDADPVQVWDAEGNQAFGPYFAKKGLALVDRDYTLRLDGGTFSLAGAEDTLDAGLKQSGGEFTLSAYIRPAAPVAAGCLVAYGPEHAKPLFALTQEKDALTFAIRTAGQPAKLLTLKSADPFHLVLAVSPKATVVYRDGQQVASLPGMGGDFSTWPKGLLFFGNSGAEDCPWHGRLEFVSLHNKAVSADEAKAMAKTVADAMADRPEVPMIELAATLLARSTYPVPWDEGFTYRDVLSVCEYRVDKVIRGQFEPKKIRVAEWMFVDQIFLTNSAKKVGSQHRLVVEQLDVNPQLTTMERADTLELDMDATVYYELSPLKALPKDQQPKPETRKQK